jgi:hypothetical protein
MKKDIGRDKAGRACERDKQQHLEPGETVSFKSASDSLNLMVTVKLRKYFHSISNIIVQRP